MREAGAKGPRRRERESHRRRDLKGSDWKWRMERESRSGMVKKLRRVMAIVFGWRVGNGDRGVEWEGE